jgi:hypothetical protein
MNSPKWFLIVLISLIYSAAMAQSATTKAATPPVAKTAPTPSQLDTIETLDTKIEKYFSLAKDPRAQAAFASASDINKFVGERFKLCPNDQSHCLNISKIKPVFCEKNAPPFMANAEIWAILFQHLSSDSQAKTLADSIKDCTRSANFEKLQGLLLLLQTVSNQKWYSAENQIFKILLAEYRGAPTPIEPALVALLNTANSLDSQKLPLDLPMLRFLVTISLDWAAKSDMTKLSQPVLFNWVSTLMFSLPNFGESKRIVNYFSSHPQVKKALPINLAIELTDTQCNYWRDTQQFATCQKEIELTKKHPKYNSNMKAGLELDEARSLHSQGLADQAIAKMNTIMTQAKQNNAKELLPWVYILLSIAEVPAGKLKEAQAHMALYDKTFNTVTHRPWYNFYGPSQKAIILLELKDYVRAKQEFTTLRGNITKTIRGSIDILAWTDLHLLAIAALTKDKAGVTDYYSKLKADVAQLPSYHYLEIIGDAVTKAAAGKYSPADLEPARKIVGPKYPDLKRFEGLIARIKAG